MTNADLEIGPFERAIQRLGEGSFSTASTGGRLSTMSEQAALPEPGLKSHDRQSGDGFKFQADTSDTQIRDGLVQRFKFTYELGHKVLKRYLEYASANPEEIDSLAFSGSTSPTGFPYQKAGRRIRTGNEQGLLLGDWPDWRDFREMRGKTSHTYNEDVALEVVGGIPRFLEEDATRRDLSAQQVAGTLVTGHNCPYRSIVHFRNPFT